MYFHHHDDTVKHYVNKHDETLHLLIQRDMSPESPREWDQIGTMVCAHRRYNLGDVQCHTATDVEEELPDEDDAVILPLYLYDHSGITMRTGPFPSRWDSGQVGYIYATREDVEKAGLKGKTDAEIKEMLKGEVAEYDLYLQGEVYGFSLERWTECEHCGSTIEETLDTCYGIYADSDKVLLDTIKSMTILPDDTPHDWREVEPRRMAI